MISRPKKSLGQHFLTDSNIIRKIIGHISPKETDVILEIGPGRGALTQSLLDSGCSLTSLELDTDLANEWKAKEVAYPQFRCVEGNAISLDWTPYLPCDKVVGNIPYNISRSLMYKLFSHRRNINEAILMVQKEFAEKLLATPGSKSYGILSVLTRCYSDITYLFTIPPTVFNPPPRVVSACIHIRFKSLDINDQLLIDCIQSAFQQRRKTLQNSLKKYYSPDLKDVFDWSQRADSIEAADYLKLLRLLEPDK
ncbi:MAG: ribosomal RNA small subunit methyltransferase A [Candidatus Marinimicrobia bacterium]|nr:ribosomal RNA small subunit methyltransferase A [Candidatus Neomarinimicrobiota bacterium]